MKKYSPVLGVKTQSAKISGSVHQVRKVISVRRIFGVTFIMAIPWVRIIQIKCDTRDI